MPSKLLLTMRKLSPPEITQGGFLVGLGNLSQSWSEIGGRFDTIRLRDLGQDVGGLLGPRLGDQPAGGLWELVPGEEEDANKRSNGDDLDQPPGSNQPTLKRKRDQCICEEKMVLTDQREGNLTKIPGKPQITDNILPEIYPLNKC